MGRTGHPTCPRTSSERNQSTLKKPTTNLIIDYGFPVFMVSWNHIKYMAFASYFLNAIVMIFSICLLYAGQRIASHIAVFINMITVHDGSSLPACLFLVGFLCLVISSLFIYAVEKSCQKTKDEYLNKTFFVFVVMCLVISIIVMVLGIFTYVQETTLDNRICDGIIEGMKQYKDNCLIKNKIDSLQLTFQCCGSRGYSDWFNITWYDSPLPMCVEYEEKDETPFSCCSMHSTFPCIHHNIMSVGTAYLYAPETNLSISEYGCLPVLTCYTKLITWRTALCFFILGILLLITACLARFIQTAHMEFYKFQRGCYWHTSWLFGRFRGVICSKKCKKPPKPPPFPLELQSS